MSKKLDLSLIVNSLKECLPRDREFIGLHEPCFGGNEWKYVKDCLDTGWVSSAGKYVDRFEQQLAEYTGVKRAVAVVNGTAALHICLQLAGVKPGDEVLVPALTFIATANAIVYCDAVPHFVEAEKNTLGMDAQALDEYLNEIGTMREGECYNKDTGRRIRAVVPMHTFGHPVDLDLIAAVAQKYHLILVEDAAESLGSFYKGRHTGNWGLLTALSFNGNKVITTGGGGAILTNDEDLGKLAKHITTTAKVPHRWEFYHDRVGYNYRLPNINAALGCAQLEQLPVFLSEKRKLAKRYQEAFSTVRGVVFFTEPAFAQSNYWLNVLLLDSQYCSYRDNLLELLNNHGLQARPVWKLMPTMTMYAHYPRMGLSVAEELTARIINIPSSAFLSGN